MGYVIIVSLELGLARARSEYELASWEPVPEPGLYKMSAVLLACVLGA